MYVWQNEMLPLFMRVYLYALYHHGQRLVPHQLRMETNANSATSLSSALRRCRELNLITPNSNTRYLYAITAYDVEED